MLCTQTLKICRFSFLVLATLILNARSADAELELNGVYQLDSIFHILVYDPAHGSSAWLSQNRVSRWGTFTEYNTILNEATLVNTDGRKIQVRLSRNTALSISSGSAAENNPVTMEQPVVEPFPIETSANIHPHPVGQAAIVSRSIPPEKRAEMRGSQDITGTLPLLHNVSGEVNANDPGVREDAQMLSKDQSTNYAQRGIPSVLLRTLPYDRRTIENVPTSWLEKIE